METMDHPGPGDLIIAQALAVLAAHGVQAQAYDATAAAEPSLNETPGVTRLKPDPANIGPYASRSRRVLIVCGEYLIDIRYRESVDNDHGINPDNEPVVPIMAGVFMSEPVTFEKRTAIAAYTLTSRVQTDARSLIPSQFAESEFQLELARATE